MTVPDLMFIVCFLTFVVLLLRLLWFTIRRRWPACFAAARLLLGFCSIYAVLLAGFGLLMPRRELAPGVRKCFDEWCVTADALESQSATTHCTGAGSVWMAKLTVSSTAQRIRQRASDASIELEDAAGQLYQPCAAPGPHQLRDFLEPGESFPVSLPFGLPTSSKPAGLVMHHGAFPGVIIIGDDQSWLHRPTLMRFQ